MKTLFNDTDTSDTGSQNAMSPLKTGVGIFGSAVKLTGNNYHTCIHEGTSRQILYHKMGLIRPRVNNIHTFSKDLLASGRFGSIHTIAKRIVRRYGDQKYVGPV